VRRGPALALSLSVLLALTACTGSQDEDPRPVVVVSVLPQEYLVDRIAGDAVRVEVLIPPGASPASHEPGIAQMRALSRAALCLRVGHSRFPFERTWLDPLLAETPQLLVIDGSAGAAARPDDPHVWLAPRQMERTAIQLQAALAEILPDQRQELGAELASFRREIDALDAEIRGILEERQGRRFLVFHPAWGRFAAAYGLEQVAIERDGKEPDPHALARSIEAARRAGVKVVFVQPQFDPASAETVAREIGARVEALDPLAYDWADNLRHVAQALAEGLFE
jgi:zinc transport system substrate-binding protein